MGGKLPTGQQQAGGTAPRDQKKPPATQMPGGQGGAGMQALASMFPSGGSGGPAPGGQGMMAPGGPQAGGYGPQVMQMRQQAGMPTGPGGGLPYMDPNQAAAMKQRMLSTMQGLRPQGYNPMAGTRYG